MHSGKPYGDGKEGLFLNKITVICPLDEGQTLSERMEHVLNYALHWGSREVERITKASELQSITGGTLLFAVYVSDTGINIEYSRMLDRIRREGDFFPECTGAVLVGGGSDLYTKAIGREMVHTANQAGVRNQDHNRHRKICAVLGDYGKRSVFTGGSVRQCAGKSGLKSGKPCLSRGDSEREGNGKVTKINRDPVSHAAEKTGSIRSLHDIYLLLCKFCARTILQQICAAVEDF